MYITLKILLELIDIKICNAYVKNKETGIKISNLKIKYQKFYEINQK